MNKKTSSKNNKGFSLIVLIILGLLVAGVTGGTSLIQSAKIRSVINEYSDLGQHTIYFMRKMDIFQVVKHRYIAMVRNLQKNYMILDY